MNVGRMNKRLAYQEPVDGTPDALLQVQETWPTVATVWGEIRNPTGRELLNAGQLQGTVSHTITIRRARAWFPKPTGRFLFSTPSWNTTPRIFNIVAAFDPDEGNTFISCLVTEMPYTA